MKRYDPPILHSRALGHNYEATMDESPKGKFMLYADVEREVNGVLDTIPSAVRVREGAGPENLFMSLAVSVAKLVREKRQ